MPLYQCIASGSINYPDGKEHVLKGKSETVPMDTASVWASAIRHVLRHLILSLEPIVLTLPLESLIRPRSSRMLGIRNTAV